MDLIILLHTQSQNRPKQLQQFREQGQNNVAAKQNLETWICMTKQIKIKNIVSSEFYLLVASVGDEHECPLVKTNSLSQQIALRQ